jgi:hypothetical protein
MQNYPYNAPPTRRAISSVGRASPLQGGGHQFESGIAHQLS